MFDVTKEENKLKNQYSRLGLSLQYYRAEFVTHFSSIMLFKHGMVSTDILAHPEAVNIFDPSYTDEINWDLIINIYLDYCEYRVGNGSQIDYEEVDGDKFMSIYIPDTPYEEAQVIHTNIDKRKVKKTIDLIKNYSTKYNTLKEEVNKKKEQIIQQLRELETYREVLGNE